MFICCPCFGRESREAGVVPRPAEFAWQRWHQGQQTDCEGETCRTRTACSQKFCGASLLLSCAVLTRALEIQCTGAKAELATLEAARDSNWVRSLFRVMLA